MLNGYRNRQELFDAIIRTRTGIVLSEIKDCYPGVGKYFISHLESIGAEVQCFRDVITKISILNF